MTGPLWTISNALSVLRILLTPPVALLLLRRDPKEQVMLALLVFVVILTDLFDGHIARRLHQVTDIGRIIDPLADKIAVGTVAVVLVVQGRIPAWFVVMTLARDILIFVGGIYIKQKKGIVLQSRMIGKLAVTALAAFLGVSMMETSEVAGLRSVLLYLSAGMMAISFAVYARRFMEIIGGKSIEVS